MFDSAELPRVGEHPRLTIALPPGSSFDLNASAAMFRTGVVVATSLRRDRFWPAGRRDVRAFVQFD